MTHEVARMSFSPYKYEPDSGLPNCTWPCGPPHTLNQDMGLRHTDRVHFISSRPLAT